MKMVYQNSVNRLACEVGATDTCMVNRFHNTERRNPNYIIRKEGDKQKRANKREREQAARETTTANI